MVMKTAERWHCTNPDCKCEVLVESEGRVDGNNPRCPCGGTMKKTYAKPAVKYLDFLRIDESLAAKSSAREE